MIGALRGCLCELATGNRSPGNASGAPMINSEVNSSTCWCGSEELVKFSPDYRRCENCGTLVRHPWQSDEFYTVRDDNDDYYGKTYWVSPSVEGLVLPNVFERSRTDLSERCLYWLTHVLRYKRPPGRSLEIGCGHGGFVKLMKMAGFDAVGSEMSPWVISYASDSFNVPILRGHIQELPIEHSSIDCLILFDVLEHLTHPNASLQTISCLMKPDGLLVIQTPHYKDESLSHEAMGRSQHSFLQMLRDPGHLFLFTERGIRQLLAGAGFHHVIFEPPLFPYDMFVFAGKEPPKKHSQEAVEEHLLGSPHGRVVVALLDLYRKCQQAEADLGARLDVIRMIELEVKTLEAKLTSTCALLEQQRSQPRRLSQRLRQIRSDWGRRTSGWLRRTFRHR